MSGLGPLRVFLDANVLYPRTLRDWLCLLSYEGTPPLYYAYASEDVLAEVLYHLRKDHPGWDGTMIHAVRQSIVGSLQPLVHDYRVGDHPRKDPGDAHVHAAAVAAQADYLVTSNVRDFAQDDAALPYEVVGPDEFLCLVSDAAPSVVRAVTKRQMGYWASRRDESKLPEYLERSRCPRFAARVREHQRSIGGLPPARE